MKKNKKLFSAVFRMIIIAAVFALSSPAAADGQTLPWPQGCLELDNLPTRPDQKILICAPPNFNGTLIMYAHGYVPPQEELALPMDELEGFIDPLIFLLSQGFAFATTSYSKNGYAVEPAGEDLRDLAGYFEGLNAPEETETILLIGASEGASVIQMLIEKYPEEFDGGLAMCGPVAGMPFQINKIGDFFVIFDYLFPEVFDDRISLSDPDFSGDGYEYVQTYWEEIPPPPEQPDPYKERIAEAIESRPLRTLRLFGITDTAFNWFDRNSFVDAAQLHLGRTVFGTQDMVETASGMPFDNRYRWYDASWRWNRHVERVTADGEALEYVTNFYEPTGDLHKPLVTMHNWNDPNVPFEHEELYAQMVYAKGNGANLTVLPIPGFGHCNFKPWQVLGAFFLLLDKVDDGVEAD